MASTDLLAKPPRSDRPRPAAVLRVQANRTARLRKRATPNLIEPSEQWGALERANGALFIGFLGVLTLEWISLSHAMGGEIKFFHLFALGFMTTFFLRYRPRDTIQPYIVANRRFFVPWLAYLLAAAAGGFVHSPPEFSHTDLVRQTFYAFVGVVIGAYIAVSDKRKVRRYFVYAGAATIVVLLLGMTQALAKHGTNPISVFILAIKTRNPNVLSNDLLRGTFQSQDLAEAGSNLRHKVFAAVLIGVYVSLMYLPRDARIHRRSLWWFVNLSAVFGVLLVLISLSRSITLCLVFGLIAVGLRVFFRAKATPQTALAIALLFFGTILVIISPLGSLMQQRFFDQQGSYTARAGAAASFVQLAPQAAVSGVSADLVGVSPHNIILDAWLSGGVISAIGAICFLGVFALAWLKELKRYVLGEGGWYLTSNQFFVMALGVEPLVRAFTAGDGFHMTEWTAVGIFLGSVWANNMAAAQAHSSAPVGGHVAHVAKSASRGRVTKPTIADAMAARAARLRATRHARAHRADGSASRRARARRARLRDRGH